MPSLSCKGRALSLGMSSGTMARGCPSATAAARHTCFIRGPPIGCPYRQRTHKMPHLHSQCKVNAAATPHFFFTFSGNKNC